MWLRTRCRSSLFRLSPSGFPTSHDQTLRREGLAPEPSLSAGGRHLEIPDVEHLYPQRFQASQQKSRLKPPAVHLPIQATRGFSDSQHGQSGGELSVGHFSALHLSYQHLLGAELELLARFRLAQGRWFGGMCHWGAEQVRCVDARPAIVNQSFKSDSRILSAGFPTWSYGNLESDHVG